jgi:hypothetical protein
LTELLEWPVAEAVETTMIYIETREKELRVAINLMG